MKTCLVLEGGGLRGIYTAGVLDTIQKMNIKIDAIIGVSMGALVGVNYKSNQPERAIRYNLKYCKNKNYIGLYSLITTGNIANKQFAYYDIPNQLDPFDYETYKKSKIKFYAVITNIDTGEAEYKEIKDAYEDLEYLRASSAMPGVSKIVTINKKNYLDGGMKDPIPIKKALELNYDKIIVVLTRPDGYRKKNLKRNPLLFLYRKYPNFITTIKNRPNTYNESLDMINELEKEKKIIVLRPSETIKVKRIEKNPNTIKSQYDLGVKDMEEKQDELLKFLERK